MYIHKYLLLSLYLRFKAAKPPCTPNLLFEEGGNPAPPTPKRKRHPANRRQNIQRSALFLHFLCRIFSFPQGLLPFCLQGLESIFFPGASRKFS